MFDYVYLDIETVDWFTDPQIAVLPKYRQLAALRFAFAVVNHVSGDSSYEQVAMPNEVVDLWRFLIGKKVVTWNGNEFDLAKLALEAKRAGYEGDPWTDNIESVDLMDLILRATLVKEGKARWYKLETIAFENLGRGKGSDSKQLSAWIQAGEFDKAINQCREDVALLQELHGILLAGGALRCPKRADRREFTEFLFTL